MNLYMEFYKEIEIVSEWEHLWEYTTTQSKVSVAVVPRNEIFAVRPMKVAKSCYFGLPVFITYKSVMLIKG